MHPAYPTLPWLHTPCLRLRVTTVAEDIWVHILLVGVVYPILVVSIAVVDSATWCRVSTRIYGQPLRLFASLPQLWSTITQPLEALVTLQGKEDGKYMYISGVPRIFQVVSQWCAQNFPSGVYNPIKFASFCRPKRWLFLSRGGSTSHDRPVWAHRSLASW